jgi:hypothetical protein
MFLNCVEDARIERMIKSKFPGLRRDFASAYKSLYERDIFELNGKNIADLPLIDRLNLEFKIGLHCQVPVPFSMDEQQYVTRMAETKSFEDVMELARDLHDLWQDEQDEEEQKQEQEQDENGSPSAGSGEGTGSGSTPSDSDESGEGDGSGSDSSGEGDEEGDEESSGEGDESGEDCGQSMTDDTDDGESADSADGESGDGETQPEMSYDDYTNNQDCAGSTQRAFEKGIEDLRDGDSCEYSYTTLPAPVLSEIVVDHTMIAGLWKDMSAISEHWSFDRYVEHRAKVHNNLRSFQNSIKATVAQMVQQFMMKQAADADKKTEIAKTGILDTVSMINYRWSEDIFLKNEVHPDGKNHGMVIYLDWSGSMDDILQDTVEQLLVLVEFCRKVGIPYEVYAFSSNMYCPHQRYSDEATKWHDNRPKQWTSGRDTDCSPHRLNLYNFLSSRMNKRQYSEALNNLWLLTSVCSGWRNGTHPSPDCLNLGCTPLNEAVVCAMTQVPEFQRLHGVQIVNTVFLTDGEGHSMIRNYYYRGKSFVTDHKSKKNYEITNGHYGSGETNALLNMLRDRTGTNLVGIRLHAAGSIKNMRYDIGVGDMEFDRLKNQYKTENYITLPSAYDEYFIVKGNLKVETDALENLGDNESYTKIKNAFIKGGNRKKSSRVIASRMVEIFAS